MLFFQVAKVKKICLLFLWCFLQHRKCEKDYSSYVCNTFKPHLSRILLFLSRYFETLLLIKNRFDEKCVYFQLEGHNFRDQGPML